MELPVTTPYSQIGGEAAVRALVKRFYELMDSLPEAYGIRKMHPESLAGSEEKLFMYLSGWLGGPNLYVERHGQPFLRARHLPFAIGDSERDQWMLCMRQAMDETLPPGEVRDRIEGALDGLAAHMRNRG